MATRFKPWIDSAITGDSGNILSYSDFAADSQRGSGFVSGTVASSVRANTALRQANLVVAAFMNVIAPTSTSSVESPVSAVENDISTFFNQYSKRSGNGTENNVVLFGANNTIKNGFKITIATRAPLDTEGNNGDIWFQILS